MKASLFPEEEEEGDMFLHHAVTKVSDVSSPRLVLPGPPSRPAGTKLLHPPFPSNEDFLSASLTLIFVYPQSEVFFRLVSPPASSRTLPVPLPLCPRGLQLRQTPPGPCSGSVQVQPPSCFLLGLQNLLSGLWESGG